MTRRLTLLIALCAAWLLPIPARAQVTAPAAAPLRIEPIDNGFVIAPDARFTAINDEFATLAGVYGGWQTDRTLLVGAGAYWLANRHDGFKMQYGGGLARWTMGGHRRVGVTAGALIGLGDATLSKTYGELFGSGPTEGARSNRNGPMSFRGRNGWPVTVDTPLRVSDHFFIAEPQVSALVRITNWMRLDAGVGYRVIGGADLLNEDLRGVSGAIALQFGGR